MTTKRLLAVLIALLLVPIGLWARDFNVVIKNQTPEATVNLLEKETGYNFVYNKSLFKDKNLKVNGTFKAKDINDLLADVIGGELGLDYRVVGNTVTLRKFVEGQKVFFTIVGKVVDENGDALPGATVQLKGSNTATATDIDGNFAITANAVNPTLVVSYIGMSSKSVHVNALKNKALKIELQPNPVLMDEIVVTGYQNLKRENATGAYQVISSEDFEKRYTGDIIDNLEGKIPGLVVSSGDSENPEERITIRGTSTFEASTAPLIVVDGLPIEGGLASVNPYDIGSITVLKDAAASAIYGARASNGVIVVTTKRAKGNKYTVDFNADVTVSEQQSYKNMNWASAEEMLQLEKWNFESILKNDPSILTAHYDMLSTGQIKQISPAQRLLLRNWHGDISDAELNSQFDAMARNDYQQEWRDLAQKNAVRQQYNVALRSHGNYMDNNVVFNYSKADNGVVNTDNSTLSFKYDGILRAANWVDFTFGAQVLNTTNKSDILGAYGGQTSYLPYQTMYNPDGTLARMEANIIPTEVAFSDPTLELKDPTYNLAEDLGMNRRKYNYTNIRTHIQALVRLPLQGWTAQAMFQYEDISSRTENNYAKDSYHMRNMFDLYTRQTETTVNVWGPMGITQEKRKTTYHDVPDGDLRTTDNVRGKYYTFRAQTRYARTFGKHDIDVVAGLEYRQTHNLTDNAILFGYDDRTQTNSNSNIDWSYFNRPSTGALGGTYQPYGAPNTFTTTDVLHRYWSYYFTGNYVFDSRYSVSGSYRVDKTDLFGVDPKFRGRPLWSVGASWNAHNEKFLQDIDWLSALKLRGSYGLTGNINQNVSSYLTARVVNNQLTGEKYANMLTPPNDQLRWEKTATWNLGLDFGFLNYRIFGSLDYYYKKSSDLLTMTDIDPTVGIPIINSGRSMLTINSGEMKNHGVELQLNGVILPAVRRQDLGISLGFNIALNKNKITHVSHKINTGEEYMRWGTLHQGYEFNSLFSFRYAGVVERDGAKFFSWYDKNGEVHTESPNSSVFTPEDAVYSGTIVPKVSGSITPTITWNGFSLSAMMNFYTGHVMRVDGWAWNGGGSEYGYTGVVNRELLRYWQGEDVPANGFDAKNWNYFGSGARRDTGIAPADYMKFRNLVLGYSFDKKLIKRIGLSDLRLRFQVNNLATWARNKYGIDPEAYNLFSGDFNSITPRSYTFSLFFSL